jgi:hypothetical protein
MVFLSINWNELIIYFKGRVMMKSIGILTLGISFILLILLSAPKVGKSYLLVDNTGCTVCHAVGIPGGGGGTLHGLHSNCLDCHNGTPQAGNVHASSCMECHISIDAQACDLVEIHVTYTSDCVMCHVECETASDDFCKGNFDFDQDVDGTDAAAFKEHFGRSQFSNPCPKDGPAPVEKTHQTTSYATGDDGDHQSGVSFPSPRFTDNGDGTVTDNLTGLTWLKDANCFGARTWDLALSDCNGLADGSCSLSDGSQAGDWRLPNYKELFSLVDAQNFNPALPSGHPFTNVQSAYYWSSTTDSSGTYDAWAVYMVFGYVGVDNKGFPLYAWPVRGGH